MELTESKAKSCQEQILGYKNSIISKGVKIPFQYTGLEAPIKKVYRF